jgi:hypothetical protein
MRADRLLRLYPRAWRDRYSDEFLALVGPDRLRARQVVDISMGAIDAWLSSDVRRSAAGASATANGGGAMLTMMKAAACGGAKYRMTSRDVVISTTIMLGGSLLMAVAAMWISWTGHPGLGGAVANLGFPLSVTASMHFLYMKTYPARVRVVVLGTMLVILLGATWLATLT